MWKTNKKLLDVPIQIETHIVCIHISSRQVRSQDIHFRIKYFLNQKKHKFYCFYGFSPSLQRKQKYNIPLNWKLCMTNFFKLCIYKLNAHDSFGKSLVGPFIFNWCLSLLPNVVVVQRRQSRIVLIFLLFELEGNEERVRARKGKESFSD